MDAIEAERKVRKDEVFQMSMLREWCFMRVAEVDISKKKKTEERKKHGLTFDRLDEEEYQQALGRIRDTGILNGLHFSVIDKTFRLAHMHAANIYK